MNYYNTSIIFRIQVLLLIFTSIAIFIVPVSAETIVSVDNVYVEPGDSAVVPVMINNVTDLGCADITLIYNHSIIRVSSISNSDFDFMNGVDNDSAGTVRICAIDYSIDGLSGDIKLAELILEGIGNPDDISTLDLIINELKEGGVPETTIPAQTENGTFGIINSPEPPFMLLNTTGCHWINWTWISGSYSDLVEVRIDDEWKENCTVQYYNSTYPSHATITISLRGYNSCLNKYSMYLNQTITIPNHPPVAIATSVHHHNNLGSTYPCNTIINASSSYDPDGNIANYHWNFGDESSGTGELAEHSYSSYNWNGTGYDPFIVSLTVTDDLDPLINNTITIPVNVYIAGDITGDGRVNIADATVLGLEFGADCICTDHCWTGNDNGDRADLNNDCHVNIGDAMILGTNWGQTAW